MARIPQPRGPITERLFSALEAEPYDLEPGAFEIETAAPLSDDDLQLGLYACYELHYRGFEEAREGWEWDPSLLALRCRLESVFEAGLYDELGIPEPEPVDPAAMDLALREVVNSDDAPSLARHIERHADLDQVREFMIHRSAYQLKEADPHTWAIPRLHGPPKAAMIEIQADEYGGGRPERVHAQLFAEAMAAVGLDPTYGAYLERIPGVTLATVNLMSLFGLHRRWLGAIVGHLALLEMTSSAPNRRYGNGLRRLGFGREATEFFDEHVIADSVHENIAAVDLAGGLARQQPALSGDILWGARSLIALEGAWATRVLDCWREGRSSLLAQTPDPLPAHG